MTSGSVIMGKERFMLTAIKEGGAGMRAGHGGPFGAVIVKGDEVIAAAHNTVLLDKDPTQHAEMRAISLAARKLGNYDLSGCEIYSTTEPCPMCFSAIHWARLDRVIYGTGIEDVKKRGFNELTIPAAEMKERGRARVEIEDGFMLRECLDLLSEWDRLPSKKIY